MIYQTSPVYRILRTLLYIDILLNNMCTITNWLWKKKKKKEDHEKELMEKFQ